MSVEWFAECFDWRALRPSRPIRCPHYGTHERCTVALGTEPRLFGRNGKCEASR